MPIHRHADPCPEPREEIQTTIGAFTRRRVWIEQSRLLVHVTLDAAQCRVEDTQKTICEIRAGRFGPKNGRQGAAQTGARKLHSRVLNGRRYGAFSRKHDAQPNKATTATAYETVPLASADLLDDLLRLPRVRGQVLDLYDRRFSFGRVGLDAYAAARRNASTQHDAMPDTTVQLAVER